MIQLQRWWEMHQFATIKLSRTQGVFLYRAFNDEQQGAGQCTWNPKADKWNIIKCFFRMTKKQFNTTGSTRFRSKDGTKLIKTIVNNWWKDYLWQPTKVLGTMFHKCLAWTTELLHYNCINQSTGSQRRKIDKKIYIKLEKAPGSHDSNGVIQYKL